MPLPVVRNQASSPEDYSALDLNLALTTKWLVAFLREEVTSRRGFSTVVVGLSGGVDSALSTYLCARAFGPANVVAVRMPYATSSRESLDHAQLVIDDLGVRSETFEITRAVDGLAGLAVDVSPLRKGNFMARMRMVVLFDLAAKENGIPVGTGNKTERLFGYFTWHGDDAPPVNPLGDLFKSQVWALARYVGVPSVIVDKAPTADLVRGQTDEADLGISYRKADLILHYVLQGYTPERLVDWGFGAGEVHTVVRRLNRTHWKRNLPATAIVSSTAIGEYYLRPTDYSPPLPGAR